MRRFALALAVSVGCPLLGCAPAGAPTAPNVVILLADDLGWNNVGYHDGNIATPRIDQFAAESLVLDRFYVTPVCASTRAGLLTGRYPHRVGVPFLPDEPQLVAVKLSPDARLMGDWLSEAGYGRRALIGKWGLGKSHPLTRGFTQFYGLLGGSVGYFTHRSPQGDHDWHRDRSLSHAPGYATDLIADESVAFIAADHAAPFLLFVAFNAPHVPLQAKPEVLAALGARPDLIAPFMYREDEAENAVLYAAMVMTLDTAIGRILDAIDGAGLRDDTLVLFASDNGALGRIGSRDNAPLRGHKNSLFEGGIRVPAVIRWPGRLAPGRSSALAAFIDVVPTLIQAAGGEPGAEAFDGISLIDVLAGNAKAEDRTLFLTPTAAVSSRWKLIDGELYDLSLDPGETQDVAAENPGIARRLEQELARLR